MIQCEQCSKMFPVTERDIKAFCPKCSKKKCDVCLIVLSNKYQCRICKQHHGAPAKNGTTCQDCFTNHYDSNSRWTSTVSSKSRL